MTGSLRSTAKNPVAIALMGILMLIFLLLGVGGGSRLPDFLGGNANAVVSAGSHVTSATDFRRIFEQQREKLEQQSGEAAPMDTLVQNGLDQQLLDAIAVDDGENEMLTKAGIVPAPQLVDDEIKKLPGAFDRVTGKFSEQQFLELLASNGLTPKQAEAELSDEVAQRHFNVAIEAGFKAPKLYSALSAVAGLENRDISLFVLPPNIVLKPAAPTDAQLAQFEKAHAAQLMLPERRTITLVRFSAAAVAPSIKLDPKAIQQAFAAQKASLTTPETRTIIQIPVRNPAEGAKAAKLLAAGGDPTQIARSLGAEPVIYTDQPLSAIADPKIGAAAFAMKAGQTAGPISGTLGMAAIKVVKVTAGKAADFATAEPKIEADLRERQAEDQAYNQSQNFDNLREAGDTIAQAAQKVGAALVTVGPVDAKGQDANGKTNPLLDAKMLKTAFAAAPGEETDLEDEGHGEYYALRIDKVLPPALPAIDQNRAALSAAYIQLGYLQALGAKAQSLIDAVKGGKSMDAVAAEVGAKVIKVPGMERINAQKYQALGERFVEGVFGASRGDVFGSMTPKGVVIARLDAIRPPNPSDAAMLSEALSGKISQDYMQDLEGQARLAAARSVKVRTNLKLARQAIGVDPATIAKLGGGAAKR